VISALFAAYITNFSSYDKTYGSLAGVDLFGVVVLTNVSLLLGAEVNAEFEHERAIAEGLPEDVRPFAEPRDTSKLHEADRRAVEEAQAVRRTSTDLQKSSGEQGPEAESERPAEAQSRGMVDSMRGGYARINGETIGVQA
jgi:hypothetical protein